MIFGQLGAGCREIEERVETGEIVEIASIDAVFMQVAEKMSRETLGVAPRVLASWPSARDARANTEIISLTQKALPKRVSAKFFAASIRHKTNDLFVPIYGIGLAVFDGIGLTSE
jgi:hypothetical protein